MKEHYSTLETVERAERTDLKMAFILQRGAHTFFLRMGKVPRWGDYTVNLIHYEDAARLAAAVSHRSFGLSHHVL